MSLSTYAALQSSIAIWLERADLTTTIPDLIKLAEAQFNRALRVRRMIERSTAVISDAYSAVPLDFLETISLTMTDGATAWDLSPAPPETIDAAATGQQTGRPRYWSVVGDEVRYYPVPASAYTATLTYYTRVPALTDSNTTNWVLLEHPDVYLFGALKEAGPFLRDNDLMTMFEAKYQAGIAAIKDAERTRVGPLRTEASLLVGRRGFDIITG